jgi:aspartyl-tRNA(Asn)/glutamyl-tRNA(Gln) amidotransferase subunit C
MQCMADIDREEILRIAELAHLSLTGDELRHMSAELGAIIGYVRHLREVDVEGVPPTSHVLLAALPLRPDVSVPSLDRELALSQAPAHHDGCFTVPPFVDEG